MKSLFDLRRPKGFLRLGQLVLGVGIVATLWQTSESVSWEKVWAHLNWGALIAAIPVYALLLALTAAPFVVFLRVTHPQLNSREVFRQFLAAMCFGVFLPGSIGEALVIPVLKRKGVPHGHTASAFVGAKLGSLAVLGSFLLFFLVSTDSTHFQLKYLVALIFLSLVPFFCLWIDGVRRSLRGMLLLISPPLADALSVFSVFFRQHLLAMSLFVVLVALKAYCGMAYSWVMLQALGVDAPFFTVGAAVALSTLAGFLALTPQSLGVLEGSFVLFLSEYSPSSQLIILSALVGRLLSTVLVVVFYFLSRKRGELESVTA